MPFFEKSRWFKIQDGTFFDGGAHWHNHNHTTQSTNSAFDKLKEASLPQAMRDSSARRPPRCRPGTREEHLRTITSWGKGEWKSRKARVLSMQGPPGVGKSAVAQTWSEALEEKLAAAFFFSRANRWNNPERFLPTIAYQLCTKSPSYRKAVELLIDRDPFVLQNSIKAQFQELIVKPLGQLSSEEREAITDTVVIIDGLDECDGLEAQRDIIDVITVSAAIGTSPFLWALFSRPEPHIVSALSCNRAPEVCWTLTLPAASFANEDIEIILRDGFELIRAKHDLPVNWVSDRDLGQLIEQANGNFGYATIAIRFIDGPPASGESPQSRPRERLETLLATPEASRIGLSKLDQLYLLIMDEIPKDILPSTLLLLCADRYLNQRKISTLCFILNLSDADVDVLIRTLDPAVEVTAPDPKQDPCLRFNHTSFTDFLTSLDRSTSEYCIQTTAVCNRLYSACIDAAIRAKALVDQTPPQINKSLYRTVLKNLLLLPKCTGSLQVHHETDILERLEGVDWRTAYINRPILAEKHISPETIRAFIQQIPEEWLSRIIRPTPNKRLDKLRKLVPWAPSNDTRYILGKKGNGIELVCDVIGNYFVSHNHFY